jgi:hypothetical protein
MNWAHHQLGAETLTIKIACLAQTMPAKRELHSNIKGRTITKGIVSETCQP